MMAFQKKLSLNQEFLNIIFRNLSKILLEITVKLIIL